MVYRMEWYVDGGCRGNGNPGSIGAAAAVHEKRSGKHACWTSILPRSPTPTNQRAEIKAIILALQKTLEKYEELNSDPWLSVTIHSDSRYAINCMNEWIYKWPRKGWTNCSGNPVVNQDLIKKASSLDDEVKEIGNVEYIWIPREENELADRYCNEAMDEEAERRNTYTDMDTDSDDSSYW